MQRSSAEAAPSSPPPAESDPADSFLSPTRSAAQKERRVPSVTPKKFRRFFTPRSQQPPGTRATLGIMSSVALNRQLLLPQSLAGDPQSSDPASPPSPTDRLAPAEDDRSKRKSERRPGPAIKRRRGVLPGVTLQPPLQQRGGDGSASPNAVAETLGEDMDERVAASERRKATLSQFFKASRRGVQGSRQKFLSSSQLVVPTDNQSSASLECYQPQPVRKFGSRGFESQLLDREHGLASHTGKEHLVYPAADPRAETAGFYSDSYDAYHCTPLDQQGTTIPFSLASCRSVGLTVIGDEQGYVRFFRTGKASAAGAKVTSVFKVHDNAVMDLAFSRDDCRLASACGDRSGRILDTNTQAVAVELGSGHWDSLRQVAFQPGAGDGNVLATSDRASRVQIWDLRCSALPAQAFSSDVMTGRLRRDSTLGIVAARTVNTLDNAHERTIQGSTSSASVTALEWLPAGCEHLLLTASEANARIKMWDTRYIKPRRQAGETPVAVTPEPASHAWRSYGITSMALGADASRLYAVCKDSTVYAYSTHHLILGHAPELADGAPKRRPGGAPGLGPLCGFKHPAFRVASFYVKCAVRHPRSPEVELLAVGSSDGCAVLFPTDERYMRSAWARREHVGPGDAAAAPPPTPLTPLTPSGSPSGGAAVPVCRAGTALVRGHSREVTTLSWACHGELVSASDDYIVRQWQSDAAHARHLRRVGEFGGERHLAGWADVGDDWDCNEA